MNNVNIIKESDSGWEIHKVVGDEKIALIKYDANHNDLNVINKALKSLFGERFIKGKINMILAMQDEFEQKLTIDNYEFYLSLDFWDTLYFGPEEQEGNKYVNILFDELNRKEKS